MSIRELIEGKNFYRRREYKSKYYDVPIPFRALSEYELSECETKAFTSIKNINDIKGIDEGQDLLPSQALILTQATNQTAYYIIFYAIKEFVKDLTFEIITRFRGATEFAQHIKQVSGMGTEEAVKDF
jgi:hypothetical protein